jgi:hypothetical protein
MSTFIIQFRKVTPLRITLACLVAVGVLAGADSALADGDTTVVVQANRPTTDTGVLIRVGTVAIVTGERKLGRLWWRMSERPRRSHKWRARFLSRCDDRPRWRVAR